MLARLSTREKDSLVTEVDILSDLHVDLNKNWIDAFEGFKRSPLLVIAGDVCPVERYNSEYVKCLITLKEMYEHVVVVMGNHEYYHSSLNVTRRAFEKACQATDCVGLDRDTRVVGGRLFVGCTLWTKPSSNLVGSYCYSDSKYCPELDIERIAELHVRDSTWLKEQNLEQAICVTHHLPSQKLVHPKYSSLVHKKLFWSNQEPLVERCKLWICGHSHMPMYVTIGNCKCVCNPLGYSDENEGSKHPVAVRLQ